jgi:hypothetical protein
MRWKMATLLAVILIGSVAEGALAQGRGGLEITPMIGYRWGGGMTSLPGIRDFDTEDTYSYGVSLGSPTPGNSSVAVAWTHYEADVHAVLNNGVDISGGPLIRDDYMLNGTWYAYRSGYTKPFFTLGLGASVFSSQRTETVGKFAWNMGIGIRRDMSENVGIKVQGLWVPAWFTTGSGVWCDPFYCYGVGTGEYYDQFEVSAGLVFTL